MRPIDYKMGQSVIKGSNTWWVIKSARDFSATYIGCGYSRHMAGGEIIRIVKDRLDYGETAESCDEGLCGDIPRRQWPRSLGAVAKPVADPGREARKMRWWHQGVSSELM